MLSPSTKAHSKVANSLYWIALLTMQSRSRLIVGARAVSTGGTSAGLAAAIESPVAPASTTPPWWKTGLVWLSAACLLDRLPQYII